jgi:hypothetical protein
MPRTPVLVSALAIALAATPGQAVAAPWVGQYLVGVSGGQQTVDWTLDHKDAGACDVSQSGSGSERALFQAGDDSPMFAAGGAGLLRLGAASDVPLPAFVDREGQIAYGPDDGDDGPGFCANPPPGAPASADCGTKTAQGFIDVTPTSGLGLDIQPGPSQLSGEGPPFAACPLFGVAFPTLVEPNFALSAASFGPKAPASFVAEGKASRPVTDPDTAGQNAIDLQLRFTRALITGATRPGPGAGTVAVARDGTLSMPLRCPKGGPPCAGTIAIGTGGLSLGVSGDSARIRAAPSVFPAPVTATEPTIASNAYRLRPGTTGRVRLRLHSGNPASVRKFGKLDLDLVASARSGARTLRFLIGTTHVRPR